MKGGTDYLWIPGRGADPAALRRLRRAFPCPKSPMGEAWFMGGSRKMYPCLAGDLDALSVERFQETLQEIAGGTSSFGEMAEWTEWFHYLLPRLVLRGHERYVSALVESLVTAFIAQHPAGLDKEPYPGFRHDALVTLGRSLMDPACWPDGKMDVHRCLGICFNERVGLAFWFDAAGTFSAAMMFCLKYLRPQEIASWMRSVLSIDSPAWRAQVVVFLIGSHGLLTGRLHRFSDLPERGKPEVVWEWSHCLKGNYTGDHSGKAPLIEAIPEANRRAAIQAVRAHVTERVFLDWLETIAAYSDLEAELADLPFEFHALYVAER